MLSLLYLAGHETTANQIGLGVLMLLQDSYHRKALIEGPKLVRTAIDEMLRLHSIVQFHTARVATEDVEIGGQLIRKGEGVYALIAAVNRDPSAFPDPDEFRLDRGGKSHVAFSFGIHQCLGQPLARLELDVVFSNLFQRLPNLQLAVPFDELSFKQEGSVFGLNSLPVTW